MLSLPLCTVTDSINRATPLMIVVRPASVPSAHAELDGPCR